MSGSNGWDIVYTGLLLRTVRYTIYLHCVMGVYVSFFIVAFEGTYIRALTKYPSEGLDDRRDECWYSPSADVHSERHRGLQNMYTEPVCMLGILKELLVSP